MTAHSVFKARDLGELINALPALFGFPPANSLVALGLDGPRIVFGMRIDLPPTSEIDAAASLAAGHLEHQQVDGAIVLAIGEPLDVGKQLVKAVEARLTSVRPVAGGWASDERYWVSMADVDPEGHVYRRTLDHPAAAQAVWEGHEISSSREAIAERMLPIGGDLREWIERSAHETSRRFDADVAALSEHELAAWTSDELLPIVHDLLAERQVDDGVVMRLGCALRLIPIRDAVWGCITEQNSRDMVRVWLHVARRVPVEWTPPALCLAAFASWLAGDGAVAVMAAERAKEVDATYSMARLMLDLACSGLSPQTWKGFPEPGQPERNDVEAAS